MKMKNIVNMGLLGAIAILIVSPYQVLAQATDSSNVSPLGITSWSVVATHSIIGEIAVPATDEYIEARKSGISQIRITFSEAIAEDTVSASAIRIVGMINGDMSSQVTSFIFSNGGTTLDILLAAALPDQDVYKVTISDTAQDTSGNSLTGDHDRVLASLKGDINGSGSISGIDMRILPMKMGLPVNPVTARYDINCSGAISGIDYRVLTTYMGHSLPAKPWII